MRLDQKLRFRPRHQIATMKKSGRNAPTGRAIRILLDTNIWRYVADARASPELLRIVRSGNVKILVAPSVIYEALRIHDPEVRRRLVSIMTLRRWQRLMPEAFSESQELVAEVRRLRPRWLRPTPDETMFIRHRYDWTRLKGGFWDRARDDPAMVAEQIASLDNGTLNIARAEARERRQEFRGSRWSEAVPLNTISARLAHPTPGWKGDDVDAWRIHAWTTMTYALRRRDHPYIDWLSPEVELRAAIFDEASWLKFWLYEVELQLDFIELRGIGERVCGALP
jgi:hypothetical protein